MAKKCIYCGCEISSENLVDFCERCGVNAFGRKMFDAIVLNMKRAQKDGDLELYSQEENTNK